VSPQREPPTGPPGRPGTPFGYCPRCATVLVDGRGQGGQPGCESCGYVSYSNPKVATGVVVDHGGGLLLVRRNHEPMYGRWSFPSGYVDGGEQVEAAAAREVLEETGIEVRIDRLLGVYSTAGHPVVFIAYAGTSLGGVPTASAESIAVEVFALDALPELAFPHDGAILDAWHAGRAE